MKLAYILSATPGPFTAFPANQSVTTGWLTFGLNMPGAEGFFSLPVDDTLSAVWLIFAGAAQPIDKSVAAKVMDFSSGSVPATGPLTMTLQVENGGMPIVNAVVSLSSNNVVIDWAETDAQGRVSFLTNPGVFTVAVSATGYVSRVGVSVTMPLALIPQLITMVPKPIAPPPACDVCECGTSVSTTPVLQLGAGCCAVDHNYGGLLNLAYRASECLAIAGATIEVFDAAGWAAGNTASGFALLNTVTIAEGLWAARFMLNDGNYVLRFEKPGQYGPDIYNLTVNCAANPPSAFVPSPVSPFGM